LQESGCKNNGGFIFGHGIDALPLQTENSNAGTKMPQHQVIVPGLKKKLKSDID